MYLVVILLISNVFKAQCGEDPDAKETEDNFNDKEISINDIAEGLLTLLNTQGNQSQSDRIQDLREKAQKIETYIIDKDRFSTLLRNESKYTDLAETNFYDALNENDQFRVIANNTKNIYLKMKEKMNRDDILNVLANRGKGSIMKSARRMMAKSARSQDREVEELVDEMIGASPRDDHEFSHQDTYNKYWDPEPALRDQQSLLPDTRRIYRGERTNIRNYPFMVSVHVMGRFWCGGAIYWNDIVITSAACLQLMHNNRFFRENPKILAVRIGSNHSRIGGEMVEALEVFFHPAYNPKTLKNNIAIIRLVRQIHFSYHRVPKLIQIAQEDHMPPLTARVLLLGWGVSKTSQKMPYEPIFLQRKYLPIYPSKFCKEVYGDKFIASSMFCAGTFTTGEGACDHDAGGPAIIGSYLVGVISFGPAVCGFPNVPTVFTLVGAYADWIETVNETMPGYYRGKKSTTSTTAFPFLDFFNTMHPELTTLKYALTTQKLTVPTVSYQTNPQTTVPPPPPPPPPSVRMPGVELSLSTSPKPAVRKREDWKVEQSPQVEEEDDGLDIDLN